VEGKDRSREDEVPAVEFIERRARMISCHASTNETLHTTYSMSRTQDVTDSERPARSAWVEVGRIDVALNPHMRAWSRLTFNAARQLRLRFSWLKVRLPCLVLVTTT
jgi:hypothetical protein